MTSQPITGSTILLVDDNPTNLGMIFDCLVGFGATVLVAQDGASAFRLIKEDKPDLILLDVMMPGMNGFEVCKQLKEAEGTKDIPIIFMTALSDTANKIKGFELGGVDYITKPVQYGEVLARVRTHITIQNLQQHILEQNEQLRELNASKDTFFSIIAHDLKNPFTALLGMTEVLAENLDGWDKNKIRDFIDRLHNVSKNLYGLLENLLAWSRLQRGRMDCVKEPINIEDLITHNLILFCQNAKQKHIILEKSIEGQVFAYADLRMIDTAMRNLLSNAIKFTADSGIVSVSAREKDTVIEVSVSDTGTGIREEHFSDLFRIDKRFTMRGTADESGSGLGLILCKELIEKNGGEIGVESELGKGTTITFTLPIGSIT